VTLPAVPPTAHIHVRLTTDPVRSLTYRLLFTVRDSRGVQVGEIPALYQGTPGVTIDDVARAVVTDYVATPGPATCEVTTAVQASA
jgi:hypothetical protein